MFDKRKWLAALISLTLIMGIMQPCLAESAQNDTEQTNTAEDASEESGEELSTPEAEDPEESGAQAEDLTEKEDSASDSGEEPQESADSKTEETIEEEDSSAETEFSDSEDSGASDAVAVSEDPVVNVEPYIENASVAYQSGEDWIDVNEHTTSIPADARLKITLNYSGVSAEEVAGHGKSIRYTLPKLLMEPSVAYNVIQDDDGNEIGTIQADTDNRSILLTFTDQFLKKEEQEAAKQINGSFSFYASADGAQIKKNPEQTLVIGNQEIKLDFEKDSDARLGTLELQKSEGVYSKDENGEYLQYTLTVTTGDTEMPEVKITDQFTANKNYIDSYLGVTGQANSAAQEENENNVPYESGAGAGQGKIYLGNSSGNTGSIPEPAGDSVSAPGTLVWNVGSMGANETRSLTYKVRLKTGYTGAQSRGTITNQAASFSKGYPHQTAKKDFTPSVNARIQKTAGSYEADSSGDGGTITYKVTVSADSNNTYALNNVKIYDCMKSAQKYLLSLEYVRDSFTLYEGGSAGDEKKKITAENPHQGKSNPDIKGHQFDFYVGTLQPGEQKTLTYQIKVNGNIYAAGNDEISIKNTAGVYSDDTISGGNHQFASSMVTKSLGKKVWNRKLQSEKTDQDTEISIPSEEKIYTKDQNSWKEENVSSRTFTVPSGSYRYQVVVNEAGEWDVSSSVFGDALKNNYLSYTGYLKVDYYADGLSTTPSSDQEAVRLLEKQPVDHTVWVDINAGQTFSFSPADLRMTGKKGAFVLTYYAEPKNTENVSEVTSGNSFGLSGTVVGPGGTQATLSGVQVSTSVVIEGGNKFEASKSGWYFDHNRASGGDWKFGRLYWVIDVSGREIQKGTQFRDIPSASASKNLMRGTSMTGLYIGRIPDGKSFTEYYGSVSDLESDSSMKKLTGNDKNGGAVPADADYSWAATNEQATITIRKDITLQEGEHLYIVISTAPNSAMGQRVCRVFKNALEVKDSSSSDFIKANEADIRATGGGTNFKEMAGVYAYDGKSWSTVQSISGNTYKKLRSDKITEAGTYVDWRIKINYAGDLEGKVSVEDLIPEGLDPVYVRYFWINPGSFINPKPTVLTAPTVPEIPELEENDQWQKMVMTGKIDGTTTGSHEYTCNAYYNEKTRQLRFDVGNLQKGGASQDQRSLEIQVVTKVTDMDMMLNGTKKTYTNGITVKNDSGNVISTSAANVSITRKTISKTKGNVTGSKLPFTITVNDLGEDLVKDSDTLTLVDELGSPLHFEPDSLVVKDQSGNTLTEISPVIEETDTGEKMTLKIPDNKKLTITYEASLNSAPDTDIAVNNAAYWFGYNKTIAQISNAHVSYHVEATAGTSKSPVLSVKKVDKDNTSKVLKGARFSLQEMKWDEASSSWKPASSQKFQTGTTDENGMLSFEKSGQAQPLKYNTVYCLKEIEAPEGYVSDPTPGYYVIAQKTKDSTYPQELTTWAEHGAKIYYSGSTYKITVYNRKGTLDISKSFLDVNGNEETGNRIPDGIYRFGLYTWKENGDYQEEKPLQILEIISKKGVLSYKRDGTSVDKPEFTQLPTGARYRVFELDSQKNPITESNSIYTGETGLSFKVTYTDGIKAVTIPENGKAETVSIVNRQYVNLVPQTGIFGDSIKPCELLLALTAAGAAFVLIRRKRKQV